MSRKAEPELIGRCGLYCGACPVYLSRFEDGEFRIRVAEAWGISVDRCDCDGCGKPKSNSPCADCKILVCLDDKNIRTCYECESFDREDCENFERTYRICLEQSIDLRQNLERLYSSGNEKWIERNAQVYVCKACGARIPWGFAQCQRCGRELF